MERRGSVITVLDHIRNADIRNRIHIKDVSQAAQEIQWRLTGHEVRLEHNRWTPVTSYRSSEAIKETRQTSNKINRRHEKTNRKPMDQNSEKQGRLEDTKFNYMAYGTRRFKTTFTKAPEKSLSHYPMNPISQTDTQLYKIYSDIVLIYS